MNNPKPITVHISWDEFSYVAQCEPYDVFTQGVTIPEVLKRLGAQFSAEIAVAGSVENIPLRNIARTSGHMETSKSIARELKKLESYRQQVREQVAKQLQDRKIKAVADKLDLSYPTINNVIHPKMPVSFDTLVALVKYFEANP